MKSRKKYLNEMINKIIIENNNSSILLNENMYELLGVPHDFDRKNKEHVQKLKKNYKAIAIAAHPDKLRGMGMDETKISQLEKAFKTVKSAHDFLLNGGQISGANIEVEGHLGINDLPRPNYSPMHRLSKTMFFRHELDSLLDRAHGGNHWRPQGFTDLTKHPDIITHLTDWYKNATSNREHHDRVIGAFSGAPQSSSSSQSSSSQTQSSSTGPEPGRARPKPGPTRPTEPPITSMSRPPLRHNDVVSRQLHRALGDSDTFIDQNHNTLPDTNSAGMLSPYRHMNQEDHNVDMWTRSRVPPSALNSSFVSEPQDFKTNNKRLKGLHTLFWNNVPTDPNHRYSRTARAHNNTDSVWPENYGELSGSPAHLDTHHLSMILHPDYARRALASAHSSHINFRKTHKERTGQEPSDQDLQAAIDRGEIRSPDLPIEEEGQRQVLRHIHAMQTLAIDNPKVHMNDLIGILTRPVTHTSHTGPVKRGGSFTDRRPGFDTLTPAEEQQEAHRSLVWSAARKLRLGLDLDPAHKLKELKGFRAGPNGWKGTTEKFNDYRFVRPSETPVVDWFERQRINFVSKPGFRPDDYAPEGHVKVTDPIRHHHFNFDSPYNPTFGMHSGGHNAPPHPLLKRWNSVFNFADNPEFHKVSDAYRAARQREDEGIKLLLSTHADPMVRANMT
jgi:curved DNA-binding protein CbpA